MAFPAEPPMVEFPAAPPVEDPEAVFPQAYLVALLAEFPVEFPAAGVGDWVRVAGRAD